MQINYNFPYFQKRLSPRHKARLEALLATTQLDDKVEERSVSNAILKTQATNVPDSSTNDVKIQENQQTFKQLP